MKKLDDENKRKNRLMVNLTNKEKQFIEDFAEVHDCTISDAIRRIINMFKIDYYNEYDKQD